MGKVKNPDHTHAPTSGDIGPKRIDMSNWRVKMRTQQMKFDDDLKQRFLEAVAEHGNMRAAADFVGMTTAGVRRHFDIDPDFTEAFLEAKETYRDKVVGHAQNLMFNGVSEPILGGQFKDQVVGEKVTYPTNLLAMEMKRVEPGYNERQQIDMTVKGGVLVVPAAVTMDDWMAKLGKAEPDLIEDQ